MDHTARHAPFLCQHLGQFWLAGDDVYAKLDAARAKATADPLTFQRNVEELEKIIPKKIPLEELSINSRQPIYDAALLQALLYDRLQGKFTVRRFLMGKIEVGGLERGRLRPRQ